MRSLEFATLAFPNLGFSVRIRHCAALNTHDPRSRVDSDGAHHGKVAGDAIVAQGPSCDVVPAAPDDPTPEDRFVFAKGNVPRPRNSAQSSQDICRCSNSRSCGHSYAASRGSISARRSLSSCINECCINYGRGERCRLQGRFCWNFSSNNRLIIVSLPSKCARSEHLIMPGAG
jgi:hypothetical protein